MPRGLRLNEGKLSKALKEQYWRDGYLFPIDVMDAGEAAAHRAELEQIERDWLGADLPHPLNMYKRTNAHCVMPLAARLATDPRVLDVVEAVLGPDLMVWSAEFFIKEPGTRHVVGMHQDLTYWGMGETSDQVTAWIALSPSTRASGCMDFVAGSHKNPILPHNDTFSDTNLLSRGQEVAVEIEEADKTRIELRPGQMSLHHGLTIHGSGPNSSEDRRIGIAIRYLNPNDARLWPTGILPSWRGGRTCRAISSTTRRLRGISSGGRSCSMTAFWRRSGRRWPTALTPARSMALIRTSPARENGHGKSQVYTDEGRHPGGV